MSNSDSDYQFEYNLDDNIYKKNFYRKYSQGHYIQLAQQGKRTESTSTHIINENVKEIDCSKVLSCNLL